MRWLFRAVVWHEIRRVLGREAYYLLRACRDIWRSQS